MRRATYVPCGPLRLAVRRSAPEIQRGCVDARYSREPDGVDIIDVIFLLASLGQMKATQPLLVLANAQQHMINNLDTVFQGMTFDMLFA